MSKDEIIAKAKDIAKRGIDPNEYIEDLTMRETMQGLLDLYQKEKEKNKRYEKYLKSKDKQHEQVLEYLETEKENEYLSKDKIRAKIEEIKAKKDFPEFADYEWSDTEKILFHQADILEDLLEEER